MAMIGKLRRRRFGEILVGDGLISQEQLEEALEIQRSSGDTLGIILLDLGYIGETDIVKALSIQYQLPCLRPSNYELDKKLLSDFDPLFLHRYSLLPLDKIGPLMLVLLSDIPTKNVLEEVQRISQCDLAVYLGAAGEVKSALMELVPITAEDEDAIRAARAVKEPHGPDEDGPKKQLELDVGDMDLSSENLLSSLDAAWESIFVESNGEENDA